MSDDPVSDRTSSSDDSEPSPSVLLAIRRQHDLKERANAFKSTLNRYFDQGLFDGETSASGESWTESRLASALKISYQTATNWRFGYTFPLPSNFNGILRLLFGPDYQADSRANELIKLYQRASPFYYYDYKYGRPKIPNHEVEANAKATLLESDAEENKIAVLQLPAAFRFAVHDQKIDALPEKVQTVDDSVARDLHEELCAKLGRLIAGLRRSNSDPYVLRAAERLLSSVDQDFDTIRPGVVLSRVRTVEAIQAAYDTEEGRNELFPDAISTISDVHLSAQDFLATFPIVRQIERERISLGIERDPATIEYLRDQTGEIALAAGESEIVAEGAVKALIENDDDIQHARNNELAADLLADKILVVRNFASEVLRASFSVAASLSKKALEIVGTDLEIGTKLAARMLPPLAVIALLIHIAGPIAGLAGLLKGDVFKSVATAMQRRRDSISHEHKLD